MEVKTNSTKFLTEEELEDMPLIDIVEMLESGEIDQECIPDWLWSELGLARAEMGDINEPVGEIYQGEEEEFTITFTAL